MGVFCIKELDIVAVGKNEIHIRGCHKLEFTN